MLHGTFLVPCEIYSYVHNPKNIAALRVIKCNGLYLISLRLLRSINLFDTSYMLTTNKLKDSREPRTCTIDQFDLRPNVVPLILFRMGQKGEGSHGKIKRAERREGVKSVSFCGVTPTFDILD